MMQLMHYDVILLQYGLGFNGFNYALISPIWECTIPYSFDCIKVIKKAEPGGSAFKNSMHLLFY